VKKGIIMAGIMASLLGLVGCGKNPVATQTPAERWLTAEKKYEGLPLFLRRPEKLDYDEIARSYPKLVIITHHLSNVKSNGVPVGEYNYSLADFDHYVVSYLKSRNQGQTVLVETFNGDRTYYCYAVDNFSLDGMKEDVTSKYSGHNLEWTEKKDADAKFIRKYAKEQF
jgi:hypothetical protein